MVLKGIKTFRLSSAIRRGAGMSKIMVGQAYLMICPLPPLKINVTAKKKLVGSSPFQRPWLVCRSATFETEKNMQYFHPASAKEVHGRQFFTQAFCYGQFKERGQRKTLPDMNLFSLGHVASVTRRAPEEDKIAWNVCFLRVSRQNIGQSVQWWIMNLESVFVQPKTRRCHKVTFCKKLVC